LKIKKVHQPINFINSGNVAHMKKNNKHIEKQTGAKCPQSGAKRPVKGLNVQGAKFQRGETSCYLLCISPKLCSWPRCTCCTFGQICSIWPNVAYLVKLTKHAEYVAKCTDLPKYSLGKSAHLANSITSRTFVPKELSFPATFTPRNLCSRLQHTWNFCSLVLIIPVLG